MAISIPHTWRRISETRAHYGLSATIHWLAAQLANRVLRLEVTEVVWLEAGDLPPTMLADANFDFRFLTADDVARFAEDKVYELDEESIRRAGAGHDLCFAALDGSRLAAYGWYALGSVEARHNYGVPLSYPADVAYMYKGFTHPDYRGRRLHGVGMALALQKLAARGVTRLVSTVEWTNWASLRSCERLGYERLGRVWSVRCGSSCLCLTPSAARARQVRFGRQATVIER